MLLLLLLLLLLLMLMMTVIIIFLLQLYLADAYRGHLTLAKDEREPGSAQSGSYVA